MLKEIETMQFKMCTIHICSDSIQENEEEIIRQFSDIGCQMERNKEGKENVMFY